MNSEFSAQSDSEGGDALARSFTFTAPDKDALPVLIAVPHAGRAYDSTILAAMRSPESVMMRLEDRYIDLVGKEAAGKVRTSYLAAHAPRAMLDLNRSREDVDWTMVTGKGRRHARNSLANRRARSGLGLVPRRLPGHGEIWRQPLTEQELERRIETVHRPYHQTLGQELARIRDQWGAALLIDLHSMPPLRPRTGEHRGTEFVIGDRFGASCDPGIVTKAICLLESKGRLTAHNRPYSGGYVLDAHGLPRHGIHALQLEVCRSLYLDEALDQPSDQIGEIGQIVADLARELGHEIARMGRASSTALAAE